MRINKLFIDELGSPNPSDNPSAYYIVVGVVIPDGLREGARIFADHIKFKYWGDRINYNKIIFHSAEIGSKTGAFRIFRDDKSLYEDFTFNLLKLMRASGIVIFANVTNLQNASKSKLSSEDILKRSSRHIIESYALYLLGTKAKGSIFVESATRLQNLYYLEAFERYLAPGGIKGVNYRTLKDALGSISFVTKDNNDIEEQLADMFAYAAKCKYESELGTKLYAADSYEAKLIKVLNAKLFVPPENTLTDKEKIYRQIQAFKHIC